MGGRLERLEVALDLDGLFSCFLRFGGGGLKAGINICLSSSLTEELTLVLASPTLNDFSNRVLKS